MNVMFQLKAILKNLRATTKQLSSQIVCDIASSFDHSVNVFDVAAVPLLSLAPSPQSYINKDFAKARNKMSEADNQYLEVC